MTLEIILFIILLVTTFINNGVQAYIHFEAYPLLPFVGKPEFAGYLKEYERRLSLPLLLPYAFAVISNLVLLFIRRERIAIAPLVAALVLNLLVTVVTVAMATPVYNRIKANGAATPAEMQPLMRVNFLRLLFSTVSSAVIIYILCGMI